MPKNNYFTGLESLKTSKKNTFIVIKLGVPHYQQYNLESFKTPAVIITGVRKSAYSPKTKKGG